ncbi:hypothetical protein [Peribacillus simplex]|uniref:GNAT family N-acetyltransferase n=1 Tax=Peribacillus simplex TaxID=1478 RepID=A0A9W4PAM6_9BACI|nr:hypothetical protein [Peribacillus simplex]CAH0132599.1 hypothetical protein SRABI133_00271 [Peribacillus simplex]
MTQLIRLATVKDAPEVLNVTLRAYELIRELNINFLAATADHHPWLVSIYERRGYEIFAERDHDREKIVYLRKILDETLYRIIENKEPIVSN